MTVTQDDVAPFDARPVYRIAVFGLSQPLRRLLEAILKHARHNRYRYQVTTEDDPGEFDIALVNMTARGGPEVARTLKSAPHAGAVIGVGRRANRKAGNDDLLLATFSLDVLGVLNKAAQSLSLRQRNQPPENHLLHADERLQMPRIAGRPPRVLVAEPSPSVRSQLAATLRQIGVDAEGVGTLAQAKDVLSIRTYELMILDPQQPDGDGLSVLRRLRHAPGTRRLMVPVIVLSSRSGLLDLIKAAWAGCNGYLGKPVAHTCLNSTVSRVLLRYLRPRLEAERKAKTGTVTSPGTPGVMQTAVQHVGAGLFDQPDLGQPGLLQQPWPSLPASAAALRAGRLVMDAGAARTGLPEPGSSPGGSSAGGSSAGGSSPGAVRRAEEPGGPAIKPGEVRAQRTDRERADVNP